MAVEDDEDEPAAAQSVAEDSASPPPDDDSDRWAGLNEVAWDEASVSEPEPQVEEQKRRRAPRRSASGESPAQTKLTLAQAIERISPEAIHVLQDSLKGKVFDLRSYRPRR